MMQGSGLGQLNTRQIEKHLKSAVDTLTPNILERIDFSVPQTRMSGQEQQNQMMLLRLQRRMRRLAAAAAACVCLVMIGGGSFYYHMENRRVESIIGIDVNPSVELSINRNGRVLKVRALNEDAVEIIDGMDLVGVDLNVAVNAVVGAMVTHGYLDDLDNAILVTVSNDSVRKARELRSSVVEDIEDALKENQVEAVVYDQQVIEDEEIDAIARQYGISYGKAYFLKELIDQNKNLIMDDMEELSSMSMEEIAGRIAERSYALGELADQAEEPETPVETSREPEPSEETTVFLETATEPESSETAAEEKETTSAAETTATPSTTAPSAAAQEEPPEEDTVEIDYVDYEDGMVYVCFLERVKWNTPSVVVRDKEGNSYAAMVTDFSRNDCSIEVDGLEEEKEYTFVLGGLYPAGSSTAVTVKGYFEVPEIASEVLDEDDTQPDETEESSGQEIDADDREPTDVKDTISETKEAEETFESRRETSSEAVEGDSEDSEEDAAREQ